MSKAIIFDFNGVLLWDDALHEEAFIQVALDLMGAPLTKEELHLHVMGRPNKLILEYMAGKSLERPEWERLAAQKEAYYRELCLANLNVFHLSPGAIEFLNFLVEKNVPRTIATSSDWSNVEFFIKELKLGQWFDVNQIVYDDGVRLGKPHPDIYIEAARALDTAPQDCIVVEDSVSGIEAAYRAGIGHIIALGPIERQDNLSKLPGVTTIVTHLDEISRDLFD